MPYDSDLTLVTAASSGHFRSLLQLLRSVRRYEPSMPVVIYNLGFSDAETRLLCRKFPRYRLRKFDFSAYPSHFDIRVKAGEYAWKPAIIWELLAETSRPVCWMDAGDALIDDLACLRRALGKNGFYSPWSPGTIGDWTHPGTLRCLGVDDGWGREHRNINGACIAFDPGKEEALRLAKEWRDCALDRACIAPEGSDRGNHRQDQAVLTVLAWRAGLVEGVDHDNLGFKIHQDVESAGLWARARSFKRFTLYAAWKLRLGRKTEASSP